ncbi:hypothetical protein GYMLUDRAFT_74854 [Collybiopsis luxurians FD-317 M1]|uniref:Uncharacterized protein n=1 Tax=Collybiopsis luxurians FD-317 M1 TaxID=944289 RepID=A0A0D0C7X8_9AGAR|nr:hypothetical protein GYMLUDRAFT_74854 [Collybiopsis luxurians FD-317 M1]
MYSHPCKGWLGTTIDSDSTIALVSLKHMDDHEPYFNIEIPQHIKEFVQNHASLSSMGQLWDKILKLDSSPSFSCHSIYQIYHNLHKQKWQCDADEFKSTKILVEEASKEHPTGTEKGFIWRVDEIRLSDESEYSAIAFCMVEVLQKFGVHIRELSLDSACKNTNGSGYEVYAVLGEEVWDIKASITLTKKDLSEINAFLDMYPEAEYQLCFWHALDAVWK